MFFFQGAKRERFFFLFKCFLKISEFERLGKSSFVCLFREGAKIAPKMNHVA